MRRIQVTTSLARLGIKEGGQIWSSRASMPLPETTSKHPEGTILFFLILHSFLSVISTRESFPGSFNGLINRVSSATLNPCETFAPAPIPKFLKNAVRVETVFRNHRNSLLNEGTLHLHYGRWRRPTFSVPFTVNPTKLFNFKALSRFYRFASKLYVESSRPAMIAHP